MSININKPTTRRKTQFLASIGLQFMELSLDTKMTTRSLEGRRKEQVFPKEVPGRVRMGRLCDALNGRKQSWQAVTGRWESSKHKDRTPSLTDVFDSWVTFIGC